MATVPEANRVTLTVAPDAAGHRLDLWLLEQLPGHSRAFLQKLIRDGHVRIGGSEVKASHAIRVGEIVEVVIPPPEPSTVAPEAIPLEVLFEDDDLIVVNKPPGLVVHPSAGHAEHTLVNALLHHCRGRLSGIGGVERPGIVHRLDLDTSGCLVVAKTDAAHRALSQQFKSHEVEKYYLALVWGLPRMQRGRIEGAIGRNPHHRQKMAVLVEGGRESITEFEIMEHFGGCTLVRCQLHTGRTHQIRVHLASIGNPIVGDTVYGRMRRHPIASKATRQMLHAERLAFEHPRSGKWLEFVAPLPQDMRELIHELEEHLRQRGKSGANSDE
ncbi:MAG: RluA family pseudouridine synthase [Verrucomicrobia bacterium]|nr:RluA family pseudouridine synthase [Verrucomicrobiota bacterium]